LAPLVFCPRNIEERNAKVYAGFPHGMPTTNAEQINADLLTFFKGAAPAAPS
jgi:non-heme chloroperoxidase